MFIGSWRGSGVIWVRVILWGIFSLDREGVGIEVGFEFRFTVL